MQATNSQTVQIRLGMQTRNVSIKRFSKSHCWFADVSIVVKFPTGSKSHTLHSPQVIERNGRWEFPVQSFRNRNRATPYAFAETVQGNSGWTSNEVVKVAEPTFK